MAFGRLRFRNSLRPATALSPEMSTRRHSRADRQLPCNRRQPASEQFLRSQQTARCPLRACCTGKTAIEGKSSYKSVGWSLITYMAGFAQQPNAPNIHLASNPRFAVSRSAPRQLEAVVFGGNCFGSVDGCIDKFCLNLPPGPQKASYFAAFGQPSACSACSCSCNSNCDRTCERICTRRTTSGSDILTCRTPCIPPIVVGGALSARSPAEIRVAQSNELPAYTREREGSRVSL